MKYVGIIDKNSAAIFQLQWKIGNISDMFLQYSVLCGRTCRKKKINYKNKKVKTSENTLECTVYVKKMMFGFFE